MSEKVGVTLKVEGVMKALMEACAKVDRRTLSAYVEFLVEEDAKVKKIHIDEVVVKEKKVSAAKTAPAIPDFIDPAIWADFVEHRKMIKKPINDSTLRYMIPDIMKAHDNGWDVNELIANAIAKGWVAFVFNDPHKISRPNGKEVVVKDKLSPAEVAEKKARLLAYEGLVGHNHDRFVDHDLMVALIDTAFETDQPLEMSMISAMLQKFCKSNKARCDQWVRDLIESQKILDDDGEFIGMRGFQ